MPDQKHRLLSPPFCVYGFAKVPCHHAGKGWIRCIFIPHVYLRVWTHFAYAESAKGVHQLPGLHKLRYTEAVGTNA